MSRSRCRSRAAAALALATACSSAATKPVVTEIEIVPGTVAVASHPAQPTRFELEARLWSGLASKRVSIIAGSGVKPSWWVDPTGAGVHLTPNANGYRATIVVDAGSYPTAPVTVKVGAGGIGAQSHIVASTAAAEDLVEVGYADGLPPDAAIVRGKRTSAADPCEVWLAPSLVRLGTAGTVAAACAGPAAPWAVALLDPSHGLAMYPFGWTPGVDKVPPSLTVAIRALPVALRVFVGGGAGVTDRQNSASGFALLEIEDANTLLADNRAGIRLDLLDNSTVPPPTSGDETTAYNCTAGDALTGPHDYRDGVLEVYLLDDVHGDGFTCPATDERPEPVIYLRAGARSESLLLHELGHALGLTLPGSGHSEELAGFDGANVMAGGLVPKEEAWRSRLTVGQVFRMNADPGSWLNWANDRAGNPLRETAAPRVACQCGADDPVGPCPRVVDDVAKPRAGEAGQPPPLCRDFITLPALGAGEDPVALLAGRQWGTPLDACRRTFAGLRVHREPTDFIVTENLTQPGSCPSWLAVFLRDHAPIFRDLNAMLGAWSDAADLRTLDGGLKPRTALTVHVYYNAVEHVKAKASIDEAAQVYGPDGRSGLDLHFIEVSSLPNPCPTAGGLAVCYSGAGPPVARLVGAALGLPALTAGEQSLTAFAHNVMQPASTGSPPTLTMGQLFRIHAALGVTGLPTGFPDCRPTTAPCPPIDADVKP